jgi:predicted nucleic acid-binding protein
MINKKVFLDANVIVKLLEGFEVLELFEKADEYDVFTSTICFNIIAYLWEIGKIKCDQDEFTSFFSSISLLPVTEFDCSEALKISDYEDIEDGTQIICAKNNQIDILLTYDKKMFEKYKNLGKLKITLCQ